jgi:hypothetical protein
LILERLHLCGSGAQSSRLRRRLLAQLRLVHGLGFRLLRLVLRSGDLLGHRRLLHRLGSAIAL